MFTAMFAMGLLCGWAGVFSLIMLETVICGAVLVSFWNAGLVEACWKSVETGAVLTAGFLCALVVLYLSDKFRFRLYPDSLTMRKSRLPASWKWIRLMG